jgi:hypothetical protein
MIRVNLGMSPFRMPHPQDLLELYLESERDMSSLISEQLRTCSIDWQVWSAIKAEVLAWFSPDL